MGFYKTTSNTSKILQIFFFKVHAHKQLLQQQKLHHLNYLIWRKIKEQLFDAVGVMFSKCEAGKLHAILKGMWSLINQDTLDSFQDIELGTDQVQTCYSNLSQKYL